MTSCPQQTGVGALVLGILEPEESRQLQAHVDRCAVCSAELASLRPLPALLARLDLGEEAAVEPSELAFARLRAEAARRRRTGRRRLLGVAAAIAVLLAGGGAVAAVALRDTPQPTVVSAAAGGISARATLTGTSYGTSVALSLDGVRAEERCRLVAVAADGHRETASSWTATYSGTATVSGSLSLHPAQVRRLVIETLDGRTLLTLPAR